MNEHTYAIDGVYYTITSWREEGGETRFSVSAKDLRDEGKVVRTPIYNIGFGKIEKENDGTQN